MKKQTWKRKRCESCGKPLIPDLKAMNFTGKWDGHTYKCKCLPKYMRVSIG